MGNEIIKIVVRIYAKNILNLQ